MTSVIGKAKKSVDSTVDAYMGRVAFAVCILAAIIFALSGVWIILVDRFGTMIACFSLAGILLVGSLIIHATVVASENKAKREIAEMEKSIEETGINALHSIPFDISTVVTVLPLVTPLLRSIRSLLPYLLIAGLVASYFFSRPSSATDEPPMPAPAGG